MLRVWSVVLAPCSLLLATCYLLPATCYLLPATCYLLPATCYLLPAPGSRLPAPGSRLPGGIGTTKWAKGTKFDRRIRRRARKVGTSALARPGAGTRQRVAGAWLDSGCMGRVLRARDGAGHARRHRPVERGRSTLPGNPVRGPWSVVEEVFGVGRGAPQAQALWHCLSSARGRRGAQSFTNRPRTLDQGQRTGRRPKCLSFSDHGHLTTDFAAWTGRRRRCRARKGRDERPRSSGRGDTSKSRRGLARFRPHG
ncbi:hypothetical protein Hsar01_02927 [Haloferula sargassicola]|uniref:Secreted protein n=1 Tax=Haloferula sargassicola TaxID=490096 RepID=A0ABP9UV18_9BACT